MWIFPRHRGPQARKGDLAVTDVPSGQRSLGFGYALKCDVASLNQSVEFRARLGLRLHLLDADEAAHAREMKARFTSHEHSQTSEAEIVAVSLLEQLLRRVERV